MCPEANRRALNSRTRRSHPLAKCKRGSTSSASSPNSSTCRTSRGRARQTSLAAPRMSTQPMPACSSSRNLYHSSRIALPRKQIRTKTVLASYEKHPRAKKTYQAVCISFQNRCCRPSHQLSCRVIISRCFIFICLDDDTELGLLGAIVLRLQALPALPARPLARCANRGRELLVLVFALGHHRQLRAGQQGRIHRLVRRSYYQSHLLARKLIHLRSIHLQSALCD